jgi:hypothetical protein
VGATPERTRDRTGFVFAPSDGRHGVTEWPPTSAPSVRIASANTWADMVGTGPEPALQRWSVRRVKAHTSAAGFRSTRILAGTGDPGTEGHGNCRRSGVVRDSDVLIARVPGKRAAVAFHVPTNPPKGRKSDAGAPAYASPREATLAWSSTPGRRGRPRQCPAAPPWSGAECSGSEPRRPPRPRSCRRRTAPTRHSLSGPHCWDHAQARLRRNAQRQHFRSTIY